MKQRKNLQENKKEVKLVLVSQMQAINNMKKPKVIFICGPTAIGKTSLSIELAKKINGEKNIFF